jgi:hypothetical protein
MRHVGCAAGAAGVAVVLVGAYPAAGQTGTLDQSSPAANAQFNLDASFLQWQQQTHAGMAGQLEGVRLTFQGLLGAQATVRIRLGATWNLSPIVFSTTITKATATQEVVFVPMTAANIQLLAGDVFVIETQGNGTGMGLIGSYVAPPGTPMYPEPLYLNASVQGDGGWKHGFQTYVLPGAPACYPNCDASTSAPVLNVADFTCFLTKFAAADPYANCDASTSVPVLNVADFTCFLTKFAAGCR